MHVSVDPDRCQGHARCWEICPEVFALNDEGHGYALLADVPEHLQSDARKAVDNCPERAITIS